MNQVAYKNVIDLTDNIHVENDSIENKPKL